jgi:16S rRNA (guanine527-N7)-methyltransferase
MQATTATQLCASAAQLGVTINSVQAGQLLQLLEELEQWNRAYNLTRIEGRAAMITHHLLDSLAASNDLHGTRIADLGSGAGFPGLPLAIVHAAREFTLIDATAKKVRFIAHAARVLGLSNVRSLHARAETVVPAVPFDTIVARAVAALPELAALARPLAAPGTRLIAYKGRRPEDELAALPDDWQFSGIRTVQIPGSKAERCLVTLIARGARRGAPAALPAP